MRILSYNIHKGIGGGDRRYRLERIVEVIERENPDLLCLQEVTRGVSWQGFADQPRLLAERFHQESLFQLNVNLRSGGYGNLLLSRWPLTARHQISLRLGRKKPRGAQIVVVDTPEGALRLTNFHLGLAERERHWQMRHLLEHRLFREADELPTLLVGDYNDWRNTLAAGALEEHGFQQATAPPSRFRSFPAYFPLGSLDKAFCRGAIEVRQVRIGVSPISKVASDHLPLVVDFHLTTD